MEESKKAVEETAKVGEFPTLIDVGAHELSAEEWPTPSTINPMELFPGSKQVITVEKFKAKDTRFFVLLNAETSKENMHWDPRCHTIEHQPNKDVFASLATWTASAHRSLMALDTVLDYTGY